MMDRPFRYFNDPIKNAVFTDVECQSCGSKEYCLEGEYFDRGDEVVSVCLDCLMLGKITVDIPGYVKDKIDEDKQRGKKIKDLERTPPVPWIQYNDWPVCCSDFMCYLGEWEKEDLNNFSNGDGKKLVFSILDNDTRNRINDEDVFWEDIGEYTALFVFKCTNCNRMKANAQSY